VNYKRDITVYASGAAGDVAPTSTLASGESPIYVSRKGVAFITLPDPTQASSTKVVPHDRIILPPSPPGGATGLVPAYGVPYARAWSSYQPSPKEEPVLCTATLNPANNGAGHIRCVSPPTIETNGIVSFSGPSFTFPVGAPADVKFRHDGHLTVSSGKTFSRAASVDTYAVPLGSGGQVELVTSIIGPNSLLAAPSALAYDANGNLYVGDTGFASYNGSVHVYAAGADGDVAPSHNLTGLNYPFGIAVGP
jgi:hypothetical protein